MTDLNFAAFDNKEQHGSGQVVVDVRRGAVGGGEGGGDGDGG